MSQSPLTLEHFLQDLVSESQHDSSGSFSVALEHARERLAGYLLSSSQEFLLKLVQAGVAAGAQRLELRSGTGKVQFYMLGCSFGSSQLVNILEHLLQPNDGPQARALRHLAIAINTAVQVRATGIVLSTWDGRQGQRIEWTAQGRSVASLQKPRAKMPLVSLEITRTRFETIAQVFQFLGERDILSMLAGTRAGLDSDRLLLLDRASWCPVPLVLNGRWLPKPLSIRGADLIWLERRELDPGVRCFESSRPNWPWVANYLTPCQGVSWPDYNPRITLVYDGVLVHNRIRQTDELLPRSLVLSAHGCDTDLTGLALIENEQFQQRCNHSTSYFDH